MIEDVTGVVTNKELGAKKSAQATTTTTRNCGLD
jgi:hypothetical protein